MEPPNMCTVQAKRRYVIPWVNVILVIAIALVVILAIAGPTVVMFIGILNNYPTVALASLVVMLFFGVLFFIRIQLWTNLMYHPVKRWICKSIKCVKCGGVFTRCEYTMEHHGALASFICYCGICRRARLLETGMFDKRLAFRPDRDIESFYEKKYHGETYRMPTKIWIMYLITNIIPVLVFVLLVIGIPVMVYVRCFGPSPELAEKYRSLKTDMFYGLLVTWKIIYWKSARLKNFVTYPIRRWILNNVKCPECGGRVAKCSVKLPYSFLDFFRYDMQYRVDCKQCERQMTMEIGGFDFLLRFM